MTIDAPSSWKAATASHRITPTEPMWLAGYAARTEPGRDKISDLFIKALALEDANKSRLVILTMDLIAIPQYIARFVAAEAQNQFNLPRERILFSSSHTHYGPEIRPDKVPFFRVPEDYAKKIPPYVDKLQQHMLTIIGRSLANLQPAKLFTAQSRATFANNRRDTQHPHDHDVPFLQVRDLTGATKAILFGYACHNTTLEPQDYRYCADWAGFAQSELQRLHPGAQAMFITGCGADQNPDPRGTVELSQEYGQQLADNISADLQKGREISGTLSVAFEEATLHFAPFPREKIELDAQSEDKPVQFKARWMLDQMAKGTHFPTTYPYPVQAIRLGNELLLIALGGEVVIDYAVKFKHDFNFPVTWVAAYCNDMFGYVPSQRIQKEGGYEGGLASLWSALPGPFADNMEQIITDAVTRVVNKVRNAGVSPASP